jgi:hypothetical protein
MTADLFVRVLYSYCPAIRSKSNYGPIPQHVLLSGTVLADQPGAGTSSRMIVAVMWLA